MIRAVRGALRVCRKAPDVIPAKAVEVARSGTYLYILTGHHHDEPVLVLMGSASLQKRQDDRPEGRA